MTCIRWCGILATLAAALSAAAHAQDEKRTLLPAKTLRGYGTLAAVSHRVETKDGPASVLRIACDSPQHALLTQAKYSSDVSLLPGTDAITVTAGSRRIPARRRRPAGPSPATPPSAR